MSKKWIDAIPLIVAGVAAVGLTVSFFSKGASSMIMRILGLVFGVFLMVFTLWKIISYFTKRRDPEHPYRKHKKWLAVLVAVVMGGLFLLGLFLVIEVITAFLGSPLL
jgi:drug/metabolite transporter (DMT)-like permease